MARIYKNELFRAVLTRPGLAERPRRAPPTLTVLRAFTAAQRAARARLDLPRLSPGESEGLASSSGDSDLAISDLYVNLLGEAPELARRALPAQEMERFDDLEGGLLCLQEAARGAVALLGEMVMQEDDENRVWHGLIAALAEARDPSVSFVSDISIAAARGMLAAPIYALGPPDGTAPGAEEDPPEPEVGDEPLGPQRRRPSHWPPQPTAVGAAMSADELRQEARALVRARSKLTLGRSRVSAEEGLPQGAYDPTARAVVLALCRRLSAPEAGVRRLRSALGFPVVARQGGLLRQQVAYHGVADALAIFRGARDAQRRNSAGRRQARALVRAHAGQLLRDLPAAEALILIQQLRALDAAEAPPLPEAARLPL